MGVNLIVTTYQDDQLEITREQADQVLDYPDNELFELPPARNGNDRIMVVGFDFNANLIEVGVEYINDNHEHIFHGTQVTTQWRNAFNMRKSNG